MEEAAKRIAKEKELAKVSIKKEDVDLIVEEMEISKSKAERTLREHEGNVVEALAALTNWIKTNLFQSFSYGSMQLNGSVKHGTLGHVEGHFMESDDGNGSEATACHIC